LKLGSVGHKQHARLSRLSATAALTGEIVEVATSITSVKHLLGRKGPGLLFAPIQKYRDADAAGELGRGASRTLYECQG
jgi:hypothetical protein